MCIGILSKLKKEKALSHSMFFVFWGKCYKHEDPSRNFPIAKTKVPWLGAKFEYWPTGSWFTGKILSHPPEFHSCCNLPYLNWMYKKGTKPSASPGQFWQFAVQPPISSMFLKTNPNKKPAGNYSAQNSSSLWSSDKSSKLLSPWRLW